MIRDMTIDCMAAQKTMKEKLALVKKELRGGLQVILEVDCAEDFDIQAQWFNVLFNVPVQVIIQRPFISNTFSVRNDVNQDMRFIPIITELKQSEEGF